MGGANIYQCSYGGLTFGLTPYNIKEAIGFEDLPGLRRHTTPRSQSDGQYYSRYLFDSHTLQLTIDIAEADGGSSVDTAVRNLQAATARTVTTTNQLVYDSSTKMANVHVVKRAITRGRANYANAVIQFELDDMLTWENPARSISTDFGLSAVTADNIGNDYSYPVITITGPVTNPVLTNQTSGQSVSYTGVLGASDQLIVDFQALSLTLNGLTVIEQPSSNWWNLPPGNSSLIFSADSHSGSSVQIVWRGAFA